MAPARTATAHTRVHRLSPTLAPCALLANVFCHGSCQMWTCRWCSRQPVFFPRVIPPACVLDAGAPVSRPFRVAPRHRRKTGCGNKGTTCFTGDARSVGVLAAGAPHAPPRSRWRRQGEITHSGGDPVDRVTGLRVGHLVFDVNDAPTSADPSTVLVSRTVPCPAGGSRPRTRTRAPWHPCKAASTIHRRSGGHRAARPSPPQSA